MVMRKILWRTITLPATSCYTQSIGSKDNPPWDTHEAGDPFLLPINFCPFRNFLLSVASAATFASVEDPWPVFCSSTSFFQVLKSIFIHFLRHCILNLTISSLWLCWQPSLKSLKDNQMHKNQQKASYQSNARLIGLVRESQENNAKRNKKVA